MSQHPYQASPDRRDLAGPFDIIGDVHGCASELERLLRKLGWETAWQNRDGARSFRAKPPAGRRAVFVGDLVDRGPATPDALRIVMSLVAEGDALCVPGNHDDKFRRWLLGHPVKLTHGLDVSAQQMALAPEVKPQALAFFDSLPLYLRLAGGDLVVAHAGILSDMIGSTADRVRRFCLYGDTDGETDAHGLSIRYHWAPRHKGAPAIVYGHTPVETPAWVNNTLCIDTGCCFGGALTALRWPENEIVSVPAETAYAQLKRPLGHPPSRP
jgi:protein phosphatase